MTHPRHCYEVAAGRVKVFIGLRQEGRRWWFSIDDIGPYGPYRTKREAEEAATTRVALEMEYGYVTVGPLMVLA